MNRRRFLAAGAASATFLLSGCTALVTVHDFDCQATLLGGVCRVLVHNNGPGGDFVVVVKHENQGRIVGEDREIVHLSFDEERVVEVNIDMSTNAQRYTPEVSRA